MLAKGRVALAAPLFYLHSSRCDQDSPKTLLWLFYFVSPSHYSLAESRLCFGPFLLAWSPWPGAYCFPGSSALPL